MAPLFSDKYSLFRGTPVRVQVREGSIPTPPPSAGGLDIILDIIRPRECPRPNAATGTAKKPTNIRERSDFGSLDPADP